MLEGRIGVRVGDQLAEAGVGSYIYKYKRCGIPHTFWNPTDQPARLLEAIFPGGFEEFFAESEELFRKGWARTWWPGTFSARHGVISNRELSE